MQEQMSLYRLTVLHQLAPGEFSYSHLILQSFLLSQMKYFLGKLLHYFTTLQTVMFLSDAAVTSIEPNEVFFS